MQGENKLHDSEYDVNPPRMEINQLTDDSDNKIAVKRINDVEISVPMVYGTIAFHLGRKVSEYHHLKLYPEAKSGPKSTKRPVVKETYNEIVFPNPSENFFTGVQNHPAVFVPRLPAGFDLPAPVPIDSKNEKGRGETKNHPLSHWFVNFSEADELLTIASARQQVRAHIVKLRRELSMMNEPPPPPNPASGHECT